MLPSQLLPPRLYGEREAMVFQRQYRKVMRECKKNKELDARGIRTIERQMFFQLIRAERAKAVEQ